MPNNQNELAFQLWWFAYYDHGCACVPHTFSLGLKMTTSYSMFLRTMICGGKRILCKNFRRKGQQSNRVATRWLALHRQRLLGSQGPGTLPGDPGNFSAKKQHPSSRQNGVSKGFPGAPRHFSGRLNNPGTICEPTPHLQAKAQALQVG
jgi:hypothetical protein